MMVQSIAKIVLKSKIKKANLIRQKSFLSWEKINKIALILEPENNFSKHEIDTFIEKTQKFIEVYYVQTNSKQATFSDWNCFTKQHKSLFGLPIKSIEQNMFTKKYDLVINTCKKENLFAISLCTAAKATLNCGLEKNYNESDFIVLRTNGQKLLEHLQNVETYLKMINE